MYSVDFTVITYHQIIFFPSVAVPPSLSTHLQTFRAVVSAAVVGAAGSLVVAEAQSVKAQHTSHTVAHQTYLLRQTNMTEIEYLQTTTTEN